MVFTISCSQRRKWLSPYKLIQNKLKPVFLVNNGWVPLDKNADSSFIYQTLNFKGRLLDYDVQGVGQDDIPDSEYLFRIDKDFIESETNVMLPNKYIVLIDSCGSGVECINLEELTMLRT